MPRKKVRIALAIDDEGSWNAVGWGGPAHGGTEENMMELAVETVKDGEARYWIEAYVDVPEVPDVMAVALPVVQEKQAA